MAKQNDKIVIFDWGGVTEIPASLDGAKLRVVRQFVPTVTEKDIKEKFLYFTEDGRSIIAYGGKEDFESWIRAIKRNFGITTSNAEFMKAYQEEFSDVSYHEDVAAYARSLRARCRNGILSNLILSDAERIDRQYHIDQFDHVYFSYKLGMEKPNDGIYEYVEKDLAFDSKSIMLIDDNGDNIAAARRRGWQACQATGYEIEKMKQAVEEFLKS